mgnify:CR=1 FL=1
MTYYPINEDTAKRANDANSFRDYKPGSATAAYRAEVDKAAALVEKQKAKVDPMHNDKLDGLLDRYAHRLADYYNDYYRNEAACPSILITGGANFPVAKKEKQNARRDTLAHEYADIQDLLRKIESVGMGGISADDPNAIEKLEEKLARLERTQQTMKDINAYYRKHGTLDGCTLASEEVIRKIKADMKSSWRFSDKPFESYTLSNQNAEIRRLRGRIEELRKQKRKDAPFQQLDFLVRDWQNFSDESEISACLKEIDEYKTEVFRERSAADLKETRDQIDLCYQNIGIFLLPNPGKEVMKKTYNGSIRSIDPNFLSLLGFYVEHVFLFGLMPKLINNEVLFAEDFEA